MGDFLLSPSGRSTGLPPRLPYFLRKAGCENIQKYAQIVDWSVGTEAHTNIVQDLTIFFKLLQPFMISIGATTEEEVEQLHRDMESELQAEDFCAFWTFFTVWGQKPEK